MWNNEISKWEGREDWPFTGLFLDVSWHRKTFWSGQNLSFLQFRNFTFPYIFRLGSLFGFNFQPRTRITENHDDFHSTRATIAAVVLLSNFEANRPSNENSRVGPPDLLKSGTGTTGAPRWMLETGCALSFVWLYQHKQSLQVGLVTPCPLEWNFSSALQRPRSVFEGATQIQ